MTRASPVRGAGGAGAGQVPVFQCGLEITGDKSGQRAGRVVSRPGSSHCSLVWRGETRDWLLLSLSSLQLSGPNCAARLTVSTQVTTWTFCLFYSDPISSLPT